MINLIYIQKIKSNIFKKQISLRYTNNRNYSIKILIKFNMKF